jgi:hypothetical protein
MTDIPGGAPAVNVSLIEFAHLIQLVDCEHQLRGVVRVGSPTPPADRRYEVPDNNTWAVEQIADWRAQHPLGCCDSGEYAYVDEAAAEYTISSFFDAQRRAAA